MLVPGNANIWKATYIFRLRFFFKLLIQLTLLDLHYLNYLQYVTITYAIYSTNTYTTSNTYRLTHSGSALSGFTCTSSLTMNKKSHKASCGIENFDFIVSERVQVNPDNSRAMRALTFLLFKLNTLHKEIVKL